MKHFSRLLFLFLLGFLQASTSKHSYNVTSGDVIFNTVGTPSLVRIEGKGGLLSGKMEESNGKYSGEFLVELRPITTGISLRDKHMHTKYLEDNEYPTAKFKFKDQKEGSPIVGEMSIKKDTKPCTFTYKSINDVMTAKTTLQMSDYPSLGTPEFLGIKVVGEVNIEVSFPFKK